MPSSQTQTHARRPPRRGPPRPTTAQAPRSGLLLSLALHAGLVAVGYLTWNRITEVSEQSHSVPVELVTIADETNIAAQAPPEPEKIEIPEPPPLPEPALPQFTEVEPAPEPPVPKIAIAPDKPKPAPKPAPPKRSNSQDFAALLNQLTKPEAPPKNAQPSTRRVEGIGAANRMTADLADALKSQIYQCWNLTSLAGTPNAADLVVDFDLRLNKDGTVAALQLSGASAAAAARNPYTRAAAETGRRAIYQCQGQGYRLPAERYSQWNQISLRFDPRQEMNP